MPLCPSCAAILADTDSICGHCGADLDTPATTSQGIRLVARTDAGTVPPSIGPCGDTARWFFEWQDRSGHVWRRYYATQADAAAAQQQFAARDQ